MMSARLEVLWSLIDSSNADSQMKEDAKLIVESLNAYDGEDAHKWTATDVVDSAYSMLTAAWSSAPANWDDPSRPGSGARAAGSPDIPVVKGTEPDLGS